MHSIWSFGLSVFFTLVWCVCPTVGNLLVSCHVSNTPSYNDILVPDSLQIGELVHTAGQIGLAPGQMVLVKEEEQPSLSLTNTLTVLRACHTHFNSALCGMCYFTTEMAGWVAKETWSRVRHSLVAKISMSW